jgi:DNA-binding response OmpR family regulator
MIAVIDDDQTMRLMVSTVLRGSGYDVVEAEDGVEGLEVIRRMKPDCIVSDVQMPNLDGIAMLTALRKDAAIADIPVIMCTSLAERAHMRTGMTSGADDYVTKPFRMDELLEAVDTQLRKRTLRDSDETAEMNRALDLQKSTLMRAHEERLASELESRWLASMSQPAAPQQQSFDCASVLCVDILSQTTALLLASEELSLVVKDTYAQVSAVATTHGACHLQLRGDGLLLVFADDAQKPELEPHALRALRAAQAIVGRARSAYTRLRESNAERLLPHATPRVAVHSGSLTITSIEDSLRNTPAVTVCVGETVNKAVQLQAYSRLSNWAVTASEATAALAGNAARWQGSQAVTLGAKGEPLVVRELAELAAQQAHA